MKKYLLSLLAALLMSSSLMAFTPPDEGMWLPMFVERLNYVDMQKMGLHLTAEELYSINHSSLKDAIVGLAEGSAPRGYFCTSELVSPEGLLLTNHHCGYDAIQTHSTPDHDYLMNGFWAYSKEDELPNHGMTASILYRMDDVTAQVLQVVDSITNEESREAAISEQMTSLAEQAEEDGKYDAVVKSFFNGNEYYLFVYKTYRDVRLVGAPPSSIGKFGGDTDNWMWPRHTGDFSMMRVYTDKDGNPAEYSKDNVPLKSDHYLPINIGGVKKNDFAMIWGFPGSTDRYLTSYGVKMAIDVSNPSTVHIRDAKLSIMKKSMDSDPAIRIMYAAKYAQTANYWKYYIGQTRGLKRLRVYEKKQGIEQRFQDWADADPDRKEMYGGSLKLIGDGYAKLGESEKPMVYMNEAVFQGPEFVMFAYKGFNLYSALMNQASAKDDEAKEKAAKAVEEAVADLRVTADEFFKNYDSPTDQRLASELFAMYYREIDPAFHPAFFAKIKEKDDDGFEEWAARLFAKSILTDKDRFEAYLAKPNPKTFIKDPGVKVMIDWVKLIRQLYAAQAEAENSIDKGNRLFVAGLREMDPSLVRYPDANSTLRMTYGTVLDYYPADAVHYDYVTTIKGIMEKEDPDNDEFIVDPKLKELYAKKDYGRYANEDGDLIICFITTHDITGGNSGSPVINGDGHLIGIAFDGNWEAMSGDIAFEPELQRTINVDIRYVMFVIDKMAGAQNLIDEMTIIE